SWLHLGHPTVYKFLNEIELIAGSNTTVTVDTARTNADFSSPINLVTNATPVASRIGPLKVYLAGKTPQKCRYIRLTFTNTSTDTMVLGSFAIDTVPLAA